MPGPSFLRRRPAIVGGNTVVFRPGGVVRPPRTAASFIVFGGGQSITFSGPSGRAPRTVAGSNLTLTFGAT